MFGLVEQNYSSTNETERSRALGFRGLGLRAEGLGFKGLNIVWGGIDAVARTAQMIRISAKSLATLMNPDAQAVKF